MTNFPSTPHTSTEAVTMRRAATADAPRLRELARLDSKRMPAGPFLLAELSGEIVAAVSLSTRDVVADPFRLTADAVAMLHLRASQIGMPNEIGAQRASRQRSFNGRAAVAA